MAMALGAVAACGGETIVTKEVEREVTRVVETEKEVEVTREVVGETEMIEVTRIVEGESQPQIHPNPVC